MSFSSYEGRGSFLGRMLIALFPLLPLEKDGLRTIWDHEQRNRYVDLLRYTCPIYCFAYIFHYFFVDSIETTPNPQFFLVFRFGLALFSAVIWIASFYQCRRQHLVLKLLSFVFAIAVVSLQALSTVFEPRIAPIWAYILIPISVWSLQISLLRSAIVSIFLSIIATYILFKFIQLNDDFWRQSISEATVAVTASIFLRIRFSQEIEIFKLNQALLKTKQQEIQYANDTLEQVSRESEAIGQMATQIAHDIRSPLAVLKSLEDEFNILPEDTRQLTRIATHRISDIANDLLQRSRLAFPLRSKTGPLRHLNCLETVRPYQIAGIIESIATEKRAEYRAMPRIEIKTSITEYSYLLFAEVQLAEFKRVLSNLVNNSIEAIEGKGTVTLALHQSSDRTIQVEIRDNGTGIPPAILQKLGQRGITFGKQHGSGLGLPYAFSSVAQMQGKIEIKSKLGEGTSVHLEIPKTLPPHWFLKSLRIFPASKIIVLDDDILVHEAWKKRFASLELLEDVDFLYFFTPNQFRHWWCNSTQSRVGLVCLIDYDLRSPDGTGIDLIEALQLSSQSILVTHLYEELEVRERCERGNIPLLPKNLLSIVPIDFT